MAGPETVYAIHNFEAENDDEISFSAGEPVIVLEKDEGYSDGWWQGRNVRGDVGLFPMNYTSPQWHGTTAIERKMDSLESNLSKMQVLPPSPQLPTPSTSTSTKKSRDQLPRANSLSSLSSIQSHPTSTRPVMINAPTSTSKNLQRQIRASLSLPGLRNHSPEDWDVDQVSLWLDAMGFGSVAANFKAQEISGDILLELTLDTLKELDVNTFGKRFKIHGAIHALRETMARQHDAQSINTAEESASTVTQQHVYGRTHTPEDGRRRHSQHPKYSRYPLSDDYSVSENGSTIPMAQTRPSDKVHDYGSVDSASIEYEASQRDDRQSSLDSVHFTEKHPTEKASKQSARTRSTSVGAQHPSHFHPSSDIAPKRKTFVDVASAQHDDLKHTAGRYDIMRGSYTPTSKPQNILPVASRRSADSISQRASFADSNVTPDMEGWLHKQSDKYKTWNKRWFVLKGPNLFYFKSPKDVRMKGIINLRGYRIVSDESIYAGKYCFKAQHERERTFYFYTDYEMDMKAWIKTLMKATISRDYKAPVLSSSTIPTVTLDMARRMKPRPPSMILYKKKEHHQTSRLPPIDPRPVSPVEDEEDDNRDEEEDEEDYEENEERQPIAHMTLSEDELPLPIRKSVTALSAEKEKNDQLQDSGFDSTHRRMSSSPIYGEPSAFYDAEDEEDMRQSDGLDRPGGLRRLTEESQMSNLNWNPTDYVDWINHIVDQKITDLCEFRTGDVLIELLEHLSGKEVRRPSTSRSGSPSMRMLDNIVAAFKFMGREGIEVDGQYTIKDVFGGNEAKIMGMLDAIRAWSHTFLNVPQDNKKASGGTFGEHDQEQLKALDDCEIAL
ncbi:polar growth protein [Apophysomyces sp. BC1034]|nr:polar growth protein [Apophysomyces sp. BC1015]KAG0179166.1 polar growth protein [Apophysomyces sp. BC1021]KAG0189267.1 polar growth protein [Apophysomyces sp. BC1034]